MWFFRFSIAWVRVMEGLGVVEAGLMSGWIGGVVSCGEEGMEGEMGIDKMVDGDLDWGFGLVWCRFVGWAGEVDRVCGERGSGLFGVRCLVFGGALLRCVGVASFRCKAQVCLNFFNFFGLR